MMKPLAALFLACSAGAAHAQAAEAGRLTTAMANELSIYAMMASNAYVGDAGKKYFPIENLGWKKVDIGGQTVPSSRNSYRPKTPAGDVFSNLQFDIWEDTNSLRTVIAFKGTSEKIDWIDGNLMLGVSMPYKSAKKHVQEYRAAHPERQIAVTGHSLGGGLALSVSFWEGLDAIVFNTSPRIFDGLKNQNKPAHRTAVFQEGEILQKIRRWYPKFLSRIKPEQIVETSFDYSKRNGHRSDLLAEGLLSCSTDPALQKMSSELQLSVPCYLK